MDTSTEQYLRSRGWAQTARDTSNGEQCYADPEHPEQDAIGEAHALLTQQARDAAETRRVVGDAIARAAAKPDATKNSVRDAAWLAGEIFRQALRPAPAPATRTTEEE